MKVFSEEHKNNISKGIKKHLPSTAFKPGVAAWNKGLKGYNSGEKSHFWKGGITTYERKLFLNTRRRALKLRAIGSHTQGEWEDLKKEFYFMCLCCKKTEPEIGLTEDHIIPLSKGGGDSIENIQPLCMPCNNRKHAKIINYIPEAEKSTVEVA